MDGTNSAICHYMSQELTKPLTSDQVRAARALLRWSAEDLSRQSSISLRTIRRAELAEGHTTMTTANNLAVRRALEFAGVEFIDENGGGAGVRLRKRQRLKKPR
jgi:ribosome-binding protein aMBF1 (putative translation factor)